MLLCVLLLVFVCACSGVLFLSSSCVVCDVCCGVVVRVVVFSVSVCCVVCYLFCCCAGLTAVFCVLESLVCVVCFVCGLVFLCLFIYLCIINVFFLGGGMFGVCV